MATRIITKYSSTASAEPTAGDLSVGEIAVNVTDRRLYTKDTNGNVQEIGASSGSTLYRDNFTGDGSTVLFTLARAVLNEELVDVYIDGVYQSKDNYTVSGAAVTFSSAPPNNADIEMMSFQTTAIGETKSSYVEYTPAGTGAVATTAQAKLRESVSVLDFGAVGDSNGTTGNGTDDTAAIQAAVDYANANGRSVFIPSGIYRVTAPIDFTGIQAKSEFIGESNFNTAVFADFTSASKVAVLSLGNTTSPRAYVAFKNFKILGLNNANISGIYTNFASEFTELENVWVLNCENGFVIATDYYTKITRCQAWYCTNNGFQIGYTIDAVSAPCNNVMLLGCEATFNTANGFYIYGGRAIGMVQCGSEANDYSNIFIDSCNAVSLTGTYMEYAAPGAANPEAQLRISNSIGVSVDGLSVSAFDNNADPVILLENGNNGVSLNAIVIETAGAPTNAIGLSISDSYGITLSNSYMSGLTTGVYLDLGVRLTIAQTNFNNCTVPVVATATTSKYIVWTEAIEAQVTASDFSTVCAVDISGTVGEKNQINMTKTFNVSVAFSDLSSAATKNLITADFLGEQWRIIDILVLGLTPFSGGGGDRLLVVSDGTHNYTLLTAATLGTLNVRGRLGAATVPYSATFSDMVQPTTAGTNLYAKYSGGAADYTAGIINLTIVAQRVA